MLYDAVVALVDDLTMKLPRQGQGGITAGKKQTDCNCYVIIKVETAVSELLQ